MRPLAIGVVLGALLVPGLAQAAPVPVSPAYIEAAPVSLALDAAGDGLASWRGLSGSADASRPFHALAARTPAGEWQPPYVMPRSVLTHDVAVYGSGFFALVTEREQPAGKARTRSLITLAEGSRCRWARGGRAFLIAAPSGTSATTVRGRHDSRRWSARGVRQPHRRVGASGQRHLGTTAGSERPGPFGHAPALHVRRTARSCSSGDADRASSGASSTTPAAGARSSASRRSAATPSSHRSRSRAPTAVSPSGSPRSRGR